MLATTQSTLEEWWAALFDIPRQDLWTRITARSHSKLGDYEGYFVAWRGPGVHVSLPTAADPHFCSRLAAESIDAVQSLGYWQRFAAANDCRVIGPSTHTYLDVDPGPAEGVVIVDAVALESLRAQVAQADWGESGFDDGPVQCFGLYVDGQLVAASNLTDFDDAPRDIGVLVAPSCRGRGLSEALGRHAASYAIRDHGFARWCARNTNTASMAGAQRLGFEAWCTQLAVR